MVELFQVLGGIAGFGGVALGVLYLLYRDFVRDIIRTRMFRTLTSAQATALFGAVIVLAFAVAILGIFATLAESKGIQQFVVLVGMILLFLLAVLFIAARVTTGSRSRRRDAGVTEAERSLVAVLRHVTRKEPEQAERALEASPADRDSEEFWYWKARIALARSNIRVASGYVEEALKLDARNPHSLALKIMLLLLGNDQAERDRAARLTEESTGLDRELDAWLRRLRAEGMFDGGVRTLTELEARCPLPTRTTESEHAR
ncbi:hypothetical protein ACFYW8_26655 [Streptomyces sp. NPDC002742]|uniref:hypothetical protein n=1 Tax=Streptomyces sp. NPDC002742 TaxID=3364663 RepID=UPI0036C6AFF7